MKKNGNIPVSVIIPTLNEESNIEKCLKSVVGFTNDIIVIDAGSTDKTLDIAAKYTDKIFVHGFGKHKYSKQKNWALDVLEIKHDWVLFLDADEIASSLLWKEIEEYFNRGISADVDGFLINIRLIFLGKELRHGLHASNWALRLFRKDKVRFVDVCGLEYARANGNTKRLKGTIFHNSASDLTAWINKQNEYSTLEASALSRAADRKSSAEGTERRGLAKLGLWSHLPKVWRPLVLFWYSYLLRGGFLDGTRGYIYNFFIFYWYRLLVDAKYLELSMHDEEKIYGPMPGNPFIDAAETEKKEK